VSEIMLMLNQPPVLIGLFTASIVLVLLDYLLPIDWLAYLGYACFSVFIGATAPTTPFYSLLVMGVVLVIVVLAHEFFFAHYLTNAPRHESRPPPESGEQTASSAPADPS